MAAIQSFLRFLLPAKAFDAVRTGTREWLMACPCGHTQDLWDAGGVRYMAAGEPRRLRSCPECGQATWHTIRKKTANEAALVGTSKPEPE